MYINTIIHVDVHNSNNTIYRMPSFKIVQVREDNKNKLAVVPSNWHTQNAEGKGVLMWPTGLKNKDGIQKDPASVPGSTGWRQYECRLKRSGIASYELAETLIARMVHKEDTSSSEAENSQPMSPPPNPIQKKRKKMSPMHCDFNNMVVSNVKTKLKFKLNDLSIFSSYPHCRRRRTKPDRTKKHLDHVRPPMLFW